MLLFKWQYTDILNEMLYAACTDIHQH